jgi:fatty-acyl-CoA synthase
MIESEDDLKTPTVHIGRPFADQLFVYDDGTSLRATPGEQSELLIVNTQLMAGYVGRTDSLEEITWQGEKRTAYRTADIFTEHAGRVVFVSRKGGFIKSRGYRVSPHEIEDAFLTDERIKTCAVIGVPDPLVENIFILFYVADAKLDREQLKAVRAVGEQKLPPYAMPKDYHHLEAMPKSSSGKIDYGALKALYHRSIETRGA